MLIGTLGIGIGFGLQNVVASFVSGLVIIFERPIKEGDRVVVEGTEGDVAHIRLRSTIITTLTDETIIVPNHQLVGNKIYNNSHEVRRITVINHVSVAYGTDLDYAAEVLKGVALASPYARASAEPDVRVREFADSGILMELWTGIEDAGTKWPAHLLGQLRDSPRVPPCRHHHSLSATRSTCQGTPCRRGSEAGPLRSRMTPDALC